MQWQWPAWFYKGTSLHLDVQNMSTSVMIPESSMKLFIPNDFENLYM